MWLTRCSVWMKRCTACSIFTLHCISVGKWNLDAALLGSNGKSCIKWWKLVNGADDHSACDLYLIWFWRRMGRPQALTHHTDTGLLGWKTSFISVRWDMYRKACILLITSKTHSIFLIQWYRICVSNWHWGWHWSTILILGALNWKTAYCLTFHNLSCSLSSLNCTK